MTETVYPCVQCGRLIERDERVVQVRQIVTVQGQEYGEDTIPGKLVRFAHEPEWSGRSREWMEEARGTLGSFTGQES